MLTCLCFGLAAALAFAIVLLGRRGRCERARGREGGRRI